MAAQKQDDQHERTFSSYVRIQDVVLKTYLGRWTIGRSGERGSEISVLPARYDDDIWSARANILNPFSLFIISVLWLFFCMINSALTGFDYLFFLYHTFSFVEYDIVSWVLICLPIKKLMGFLVFQCEVLCDSLKTVLVEKPSIFFILAENMLSFPFLRSAPYFPLTHSIEGDKAVSYTVYTLFFFFNHKLSSSSQNSGVVPDIRVFGKPFLENMTLRICFIVELFLSATRITSGQLEKESTSINKSPIPVIYAWSICTRLHGSTSLGHKCKIVCVKFLNSLHFWHLLYIVQCLMEILATMLLILSFLCCRYSTVDIIIYTFYLQFSLCFWENYQIPITNHSMFYR